MATTTVDTSMWGLFVHQAKDGSLTVVDNAGKPIASPPDVIVGADGTFTVVGSTSPITLPAYSPPIHNVFAYTEADGTVTIVDASGNWVPIPPNTAKTPGGDLVVVDSSGQVVEDAGGPIEIPAFSPPIANVFLMETGTHQISLVDAAGNLAYCRPNCVESDGQWVFADASGNPLLSSSGQEMVVPTFSLPTIGVHKYGGALVDGHGNALPQNMVSDQRWDWNSVPEYSPPTTGVFLHTAWDGTTTVVDAAGKPIPSPPLIDKNGGVIGFDQKDVVDPKTGAQIVLPPYAPPTSGIYLFASDGTTTVVDAAGNPVPSPPRVLTDSTNGQFMLADSSGNVLLGDDGNPISVPVYDPTSAPRLLVHTAPDGTVQVVDATGQPVSSPPTVALHPGTGEPAIVDANGQFVLDANGNLTTLPAYSPPTQGVYAHVLRDPVTGAIDVQLVDATGNQVSSPPGYMLKSSGDPSDPPTVVLTGADGKPITDTDGIPISAPLYSPPTQGVYAHVLRDPVTGAIDVQLVDATGNQVSSPPGYMLKSSGDPSDPPTVVLTGADGKPITDTDGIPISAPLYSPPTQGIYAHVVTNPATGKMDVQLVDAAGNLVPSPPGYTVQKGADPSDPPTIVLTGINGKPLTDQDGNPISVPMDSSSSAPPGASPPAEEETAVEDSTDSAADTPVVGETPAEEEGARGGREPIEEAEPISDEDVSGTREEMPAETQTEEVTADLDSRTAQVPDIEGKVTPVPELEAVEFKVETTPSEVETARITIDAVAEGESESEERSAAVESDVARVDTPEEVATPPITLPEMPGELTPVDPMAEVGVVGLGAEDLVEMVTGRDAPSVEVGHAGGDSELPGKPVAEIPDLPLAAELIEVVEIEDKIVQVPDPEPVEFKVEAVPADAEPVEVRVEPAIGRAPAEPTVDPGVSEEAEPDPVRTVPIDDGSPVGLGVEELVEMATGRAEASGEEPTGRAMLELEEPIIEIPELPVAEVVEVAEVLEMESEIMPALEAESVEFKFFRPQDEIDTSEFRVEVSEAGTLEIDEEVAEGLTRYVEEPGEKPTWVSEEDPNEEEEEMQT